MRGIRLCKKVPGCSPHLLPVAASGLGSLTSKFATCSLVGSTMLWSIAVITASQIVQVRKLPGLENLDTFLSNKTFKEWEIMKQMKLRKPKTTLRLLESEGRCGKKSNSKDEQNLHFLKYFVLVHVVSYEDVFDVLL